MLRGTYSMWLTSHRDLHRFIPWHLQQLASMRVVYYINASRCKFQGMIWKLQSWTCEKSDSILNRDNSESQVLWFILSSKNLMTQKAWSLPPLSLPCIVLWCVQLFISEQGPYSFLLLPVITICVAPTVIAIIYPSWECLRGYHVMIEQ